MCFEGICVMAEGSGTCLRSSGVDVWLRPPAGSHLRSIDHCSGMADACLLLCRPAGDFPHLSLVSQSERKPGALDPSTPKVLVWRLPYP